MKTLLALSALLFLLNLFPSAYAEGEYVLKKDDTVRMTVFQEDELATQAQIGKSGAVSFPLIGNVQLVGLSVKDAEQKVRDLYEKDYLVNAQVNIAVLAYAEKWVIVGGDVRRPGTINMPEEGALDLRGAIAQAGGVAESANTSSIVVRSKDGNVRTLSLDGSGSVVLKHGDSVTVGRSTLNRSTVTVSGNVNRPGIIEFPKVGSLDIVTAIAQAGGFTRIANTKEVIVRRDKKQYTVSLKDIERGSAKMFYLRAGDLVIVQESRW
ncbi:polysaccharide export outer membrane protein [Rubritalea squalenifaciens DSM 18772]|uniref:Polysaccharide export outer membrane protein n=1 Tax=Rubritalea squalenifaciens DSM 18772 TaxID=1123071 RepID=A0A1M6R098_9BACT|nr:polysaccharide biosynthesis/export family protein [Rubritalea squalenifaciens]SHK25747.1 polysaccharide export outer membrane protein [Rubritalea squalenifaciens DSM 18772]